MRRPTQRSYGSKPVSRASKLAIALDIVRARLDRGLPVEASLLRPYGITEPAAERMIAEARAQRERLL